MPWHWATSAMAATAVCHSGMTLSRPQQGISIKLNQKFDNEDNDILSTIK
jgi:hypothetical protein